MYGRTTKRLINRSLTIPAKLAELVHAKVGARYKKTKVRRLFVRLFPFLGRAADNFIFSFVFLPLVTLSELHDPRVARLRRNCKVEAGESDMDMSGIGRLNYGRPCTHSGIWKGVKWETHCPAMKEQKRSGQLILGKRLGKRFGNTLNSQQSKEMVTQRSFREGRSETQLNNVPFLDPGMVELPPPSIPPLFVSLRKAANGRSFEANWLQSCPRWTS